MGCLGVHFAISAADVEKLKSISGEHERLDHLKEEIEERYFEASIETRSRCGATPRATTACQ